MSIYRSILEEDLDLGGVLDNNNSVEIQQIEDIVGDQDANACEQDCAQAAEFGPSDGVDDIMDESFIAIAEAQMNMNKIMQAIAIYEVNEAASGREIIYEAGSIKAFFVKAKNWVVNFFKKVWQVLKRYAANISSVFHTNKGFAEKYSKQIEEGFAAYSKDHKSDNKLKMYTYKNLDKVMKDSKWKACMNFVSPYMDKAKNWEDGNVTLNQNEVDQKVKEYRSKICGSECDAADFREKLKVYVCGSDEKKEGLMPAADVIAALKSGEAVNTCKKTMDEAQKDYKAAIKSLNKLEKDFTKQSNSSDKKEAKKGNTQLTICIRMVNLLEQCLTATQVARAVILSAARGRIAQARVYGQAYVAAANKANPKYRGFQKESAGYGFLSDIDLV